MRRRSIPPLIVLALCFVCAVHGQPKISELTILHMNDLHARLLPDSDGLGGFAQLATLLRREKATARAALVLHGGDFVQGTPVSTMFRGMPVFEMANLLGLDVSCLGNHEFDYGWRQIAEYSRVAKFPMISANVTKANGERLLEAYVIRSVGGLRVAVIGAMTEILPSLTSSESVAPWRAAPLVETLRPYVREAREKADLLIVLGHLTPREDEMILRAFPEVSVVVSGHDHGGRERALEIDGRVGVSVRGYGRQVGRLDLRYDAELRKIVSYDWKRIAVQASEIPPEHSLQALIAQWEAKVSKVVDVPIGRSERRIDQAGLQALIEQAMVEHAGADVAYYGRGGIRDTLPPGALLARHVWNILPFDGPLVTAKIQGRRLPEMIRARKEWDPDRLYLVATDKFHAGQWMAQGYVFGFSSDGPVLRDVVIEWIKRKGVVP